MIENTAPLSNRLSKREPIQLCFKCIFTLALVLLCVALSFWSLNLDLGNLFSFQSLREIRNYALRFSPPDVTAPFLIKILQALIETLAISLISTSLAAILGLMAALPAAGKLGFVPKAVSRFLLNFLRSVPELVWATLMVLCVGLGPFAGTLALALHTTGVLGRMFAETLENQEPSSLNALTLVGADPISAFFYGTLSEVYVQLLSFTLYRWEMNIRMAAILGLVGAGGLGQMLFYELSLFHEKQVSTIIIAMLMLVMCVDYMSASFRSNQRKKS